MEERKKGSPAAWLGEFTVETLESILLAEAGRRGERLFRISLMLREECLFPWERLALDMGRMEGAFNVIRVSPDLDADRTASKRLPERIIFHVTTALPFERAAEAASHLLDGIVDIVEVPMAAWEEERERWGDERPAAGTRGVDLARAEAALLVLSYKVLRYDMGRILQACGPGTYRDTVSASMGDFEARLENLQASSLVCLAFSWGGFLHYLPRPFVAGYACAEGNSAGSGLLNRVEGGFLSPDLETMAGNSRFGVCLAPPLARPVAAERLLYYRDIALSAISLSGRVSHSCFQATVEGRPCRLILPPTRKS